MRRKEQRICTTVLISVVLGCSVNHDEGDNRGSGDKNERHDASIPKCGNGIVDDTEQCDGDDLDGNSCELLGYSGGTLKCREDICKFDVRLCALESEKVDASPYVQVGDASIYDPEYLGDYGHLVGFDGGLEAAQVCLKNSDCAWVASSCFCLWPTLQDVTAINRKWIEHYVYPYCDGRCSTVFPPWLIPFCNFDHQSGRPHCEVIDLNDDPMTACEGNSDCQVRVRQCCECGGDTAEDRVIALPPKSFDTYQRVVCDEFPPNCDTCQPDYPPTEGWGYIARVFCSSGHCTAQAEHVDPI